MNVRYILVLVLTLLAIVGLSHYFNTTTFVKQLYKYPKNHANRMNYTFFQTPKELEKDLNSHLPQTIFTCTTFFDFEKQDRWTSFKRAITNIYQYDSANLPQKWFIVNEYSATPKADWTKLMAETYPHMTFIQKQKDQKGQAHSLNLILEAIKPYDYWIQWEDSWYPERPFLARAHDIMKFTTLSQLQVTRGHTNVSWLDIPNDRLKPYKTHNGTEFIEIKAAPEIKDYLHNNPYEYSHAWIMKGWPLFSLQPSVNRVSHIRSLGEFSTDPDLWPVKFEWAWARQWFLAGGTKAVLPDGPVIRSGHISTYAK